ncbi:hypothetical protein Tco_1200722 [Tanacetum coccineum]
MINLGLHPETFTQSSLELLWSPVRDHQIYGRQVGSGTGNFTQKKKVCLTGNFTDKKKLVLLDPMRLFLKNRSTSDGAIRLVRGVMVQFANTTYSLFLGKRVAYRVVANYVRNTWGKYRLVRSMFGSSTGLFSFQFSFMEGLDAMLENGDVKLKDNIVVAMPRIKGEGHYICNVRVEYEWKPPRCASSKVFGHIHEECPKNTGAGEKKIAKKPSQTSRGVPVGPKMSFKPQKEYRHVSKKPGASSSSHKKKGVEPTIEVSNSNPFEVLNSFDNDVELGTNANLINNATTSSRSSFMNVDNISTGTTPILEKIGKFEDILTSGQVIIVDNVGNPLKKVEFLGDYDSKDEVASVENHMARSLASERVGFGTQSLLEQWRDSYGNGDYDVDPYDDDMYEGQDLSQELQAICDNLDIRVRGRKKK